MQDDASHSVNPQVERGSIIIYYIIIIIICGILIYIYNYSSRLQAKVNYSNHALYIPVSYSNMTILILINY